MRDLRRPESSDCLLQLIINIKEIRSADQINLVIVRARLLSEEWAATVLPVRNRRIEINLSRRDRVGFQLPAPEGRYRALALELNEAVLVESGKKRPITSGPEDVIVSLDLTISRERANVVEVNVDLEKVREGTPLQAALAAQILRVSREVRTVREWKGQGLEFRLGSAVGVGRLASVVIRIPAGGVPDGTDIALEIHGGDRLPELFHGQRIVGPVFTITSPVRRFTDAVELILPFRPDELSRSGTALDDIVVMQLTDDQTLYRELRPHRIDPTAGTAAVWVMGFSTFFVCTAGISLDNPKLVRNAGGEVIYYTLESRAALSGRSTDTRIDVRLDGAPHGHHWVGKGWFVFEDIQLRPADTVLVVHVSIDGLVSHDCEIVVRRDVPPKYVTTVNRLYGPRVAVSSEGVAFITGAVIQPPRWSEDRLFPGVTDWQRGLQRTGPFVYWYDAAADGWIWHQLIPPVFLENEVARFVIRQNNEIAEMPDNILGLRAISVNQAYDPSERYVHSLGDFLAQQDQAFIDVFLNVFSTIARPVFGPGQLAMSPVQPVIALDNGAVGVALVIATDAGVQAALLSGMGALFASFHGPRFEGDDAPSRPQVRAGTLFFVGCSTQGVLATEVVASDGVWCGALQVRRDPGTGQPVILALGVAGDQKQLPSSRILLFHRQPDGTWRREVVLEGRPIIDADFAFDSDGAERIVACIAATTPTKANLIHVVRDGQGWQAEPVIYSTPGLPDNLDIGVWGRISIDQQGRSVVAFTVPAGDCVFMVGIMTPAGWKVRSLGVGNLTSLTGVFHADRDPDFSVGGIGQSRVGYAQWAPAIVMGNRVTGDDGTASPSDILWYLRGDGILRLSEIDLDRLASADTSAPIGEIVLSERAIDIDRTTGFYPDAVRRPRGGPVVVYKDLYGEGRFLPDGTSPGTDQLLFFSSEQGNFIPHSDPSPPFAPRIFADSIVLLHFGARVPLQCSLLSEIIGGLLLSLLIDIDLQARIDDLISSLLLNTRFNMFFYPGGDATWPERRFFFEESHPEVFERLRRLPRRPDITIFDFVNDHQEDDLSGLSFAAFSTLFTVPAADGMVAALDGPMPTVPIGLATAFAANSIPLSSDLSVKVTNRGQAWEITDSDPDGDGIRDPLRDPSQTYLISLNNTESGPILEINIRPLLRAFDRSDRRSPMTNRPAPCNLEQTGWDNLSAFFADLLPPSPRLPADMAKPTEVRATNVRFSRPPASGDPVRLQQGAMRFTLTIGHLYIRVEDPVGITITSRNPSTFNFNFAPFVANDGQLRWYTRNIVGRLSEVDADVDIGFLDWVKWLAVIPGVGFLLLLIDEIADEVATGKASDREIDLPLEGMAAVLRDKFSRYVDRLFPGGSSGGLDAVFLRGRVLTYWRRQPRVDKRQAPSRSMLDILPRGLSFGEHTVGDPPVRRTLLFHNPGHLPALLEDVRIRGVRSFQRSSPVSWPEVLLPGDAQDIVIEFRPSLPAGFHNGDLDIRCNGGRALRQSLFTTEIGLSAALDRGRVTRALADTFDGAGYSLRLNDAVATEQVGASWSVNDIFGRQYFIEREGDLLQVSRNFLLSALAKPPPMPVLRVTPPERYNFGIVSTGRSATTQIVITNEGQASLQLSAIRIEAAAGNTGGFRVAPTGALSVVPATVRVLDLTYTPGVGAGADRAELVFETNDLSHPVYRIQLMGVGVTSRLLIVPEEITFNDSPIAALFPPGSPPWLGSGRGVDIYNTGGQLLTIFGASFIVRDGPSGAPSRHFQLLDAGNNVLPQADIVIQAGQAFGFRVLFRPEVAGDHQAVLEIHSDDPARNFVSVAIWGRGIA